MEEKYAILPKRIKATVIDGIILIALSYLVSEIFSSFESVPQYIRITLFVFIFVLYDPIFTSIYGGTIGHSYSGITAKRENNLTKNILFPSAIVRCVVKFFLGWVSLLTTSTNSKKKALHDFVVGSVVLDLTRLRL